jgi:C4-dicarboxylate-specific signal transduction histidine kinase
LTEDNENKRLEEEAQLKLAESAKLATLGEMAGGIAHEINNPLAILNGSADILNRLAQAAPVDTDKITKQVDMIRRTIQRISKIVAGLRVFVRDGTNDPFEKISARELIDETLALCQSKLRNHGIRIEIPVIRDDLLFEGQRVQISQVLLNLINNAADAIQKQDRPWIRIDVEDLAFVLKIKVIDSGTGIAPEVASKIMQPFFTTKEVGKGTGLGLSISQSIIKGHQGQLTLDTTAPNTTFVIEIPRKASGGISQPQAA